MELSNRMIKKSDIPGLDEVDQIKPSPLRMKDVGNPSDVSDDSLNSYPETTDKEKAEFNATTLKSMITDEIDILVETLQDSGNLSSGDQSLISSLEKLKRSGLSISSVLDLQGVVSNAMREISGINSNHVPEILKKLNKLYDESQQFDPLTKVSLKKARRLIRSCFVGGQLNPKVEVDPYQSRSIGGDNGGVNVNDPIKEDRSMLPLGEDAPITPEESEQQFIEKLEKIYNNISESADSLVESSHHFYSNKYPAKTKKFEILNKDLAKAENSIWSLLYYLKTKGKT